ncbi:dihydroneopterin aldolase [Ferrovibrio sp.]|uniref:dihydroneopterin aldolase n=1 Tax=Ferrovibrio sp. TaxID=1917215 RepID=UPI0035ADAC0F
MTIHDRARAAWSDIPLPNVPESFRRIFVRELRLPARIGVYAEEKLRPQDVIIDLELWVRETPQAAIGGNGPLDYADVVCYDGLVQRTKALLAEGHIDLVETMAERLAALCLEDSRVRRVRVCVEKPAAIPEAAGAGVEIERYRR